MSKHTQSHSSFLKSLASVKSLFIFSFVGVVGFLATQALYVDKETSQAANFVVGTLDMAVSGPGSQAVENLSVMGVGSKNVISGKKTWSIKNVGSLPGAFSLGVKNMQNLENGCNEPEAQEDVTCDNPGVGQGELGEHVRTTVFLKAGADERKIFSSDLSTAHAELYRSYWQQNAGTVIVAPGESVLATLEWAAQEDQLTNVVQGDSLQFDMVFDLKQLPSDGGVQSGR